MKSRFEPENQSDIDALLPALIDPEAYDASEQAFAASLEETSPRQSRGLWWKKLHPTTAANGFRPIRDATERDQQERVEAQKVGREEDPRKRGPAEAEGKGTTNEEKTQAAEFRLIPIPNPGGAR